MQEIEQSEIVAMSSALDILAGIGVVLLAVLVIFIVAALFQPIV